MKHPSHFSMGGVTFSPDNKLDLGVTFSQVIDIKVFHISCNFFIDREKIQCYDTLNR